MDSTIGFEDAATRSFASMTVLYIEHQGMSTRKPGKCAPLLRRIYLNRYVVEFTTISKDKGQQNHACSVIYSFWHSGSKPPAAPAASHAVKRHSRLSHRCTVAWLRGSMSYLDRLRPETIAITVLVAADVSRVNYAAGARSAPTEVGGYPIGVQSARLRKQLPLAFLQRCPVLRNISRTQQSRRDLEGDFWYFCA